MAAASIYSNSAGVDTSRARVIPLDSLAHFLEHFQKEGGGGDGGGGEAARLIEVSSERKGTKFLKLGGVDFCYRFTLLFRQGKYAKRGR